MRAAPAAPGPPRSTCVTSPSLSPRESGQLTRNTCSRALVHLPDARCGRTVDNSADNLAARKRHTQLAVTMRLQLSGSNAYGKGTDCAGVTAGMVSITWDGAYSRVIRCSCPGGPSPRYRSIRARKSCCPAGSRRHSSASIHHRRTVAVSTIRSPVSRACANAASSSASYCVSSFRDGARRQRGPDRGGRLRQAP